MLFGDLRFRAGVRKKALTRSRGHPGKPRANPICAFIGEVDRTIFGLILRCKTAQAGLAAGNRHIHGCRDEKLNRNGATSDVPESGPSMATLAQPKRSAVWNTLHFNSRVIVR